MSGLLRRAFDRLDDAAVGAEATDVRAHVRDDFLVTPLMMKFAIFAPPRVSQSTRDKARRRRGVLEREWMRICGQKHCAHDLASFGTIRPVL